MPEEKESVAERAVRFFHEARNNLLEFQSDPEIRELLLEYEQLVKEHNQNLDQAMRSIKSELRGL